MSYSARQGVGIGRLTSVAACVGILLLCAPIRALADFATLTDDTYAKYGSNGVYGKKSSITVDQTPTEEDAFIQFDLSNLPGCPSSCPTGSAVTKATLTLFVKKVKGADAATFYVRKVTTA